jgi:hypothetical protein
MGFSTWREETRIYDSVPLGVCVVLRQPSDRSARHDHQTYDQETSEQQKKKKRESKSQQKISQMALG